MRRNRAALVVIGDELGLYRAPAEHGPLSPARLAATTDTTERYVRVGWACRASGYVDYDPATHALLDGSRAGNGFNLVLEARP